LACVDRGFSANGGIHLREEGGRALHEADPAPQNAGRESGQVADHAAAQREHDVIALDRAVEEKIEHLLEHGKALGALAGLQNEREGVQPGGAQRRLDARQVERGDIAICNHRDPPRACRRFDERSCLVHQVRAHMDDVAAARKINGDFANRSTHERAASSMLGRRHPAASSAAIIVSTVSSCGPSTVSITKSARP